MLLVYVEISQNQWPTSSLPGQPKFSRLCDNINVALMAIECLFILMRHTDWLITNGSLLDIAILL